MRRLVSTIALCGLVLAGCGETSAADRACDARDDLDDAVADVVEEVQAGNFGDARNELDDVSEAYNRLRDAVTDLSAENEETLTSDVDDLAAGVATAVDARDIEQLRTTLEAGFGDLGAFLDDVADQLDC